MLSVFAIAAGNVWLLSVSGTLSPCPLPLFHDLALRSIRAFSPREKGEGVLSVRPLPRVGSLRRALPGATFLDPSRVAEASLQVGQNNTLAGVGFLFNASLSACWMA